MRGVGVAVGGYLWHDAFGDVDGWSLQHLRRVIWLWTGSQTFPSHTLKFGDTVQPLDTRQGQNTVVRDWISTLPDSQGYTALRELPQDIIGASNTPAIEDVADYLFDRGVASGSVSALVAEMNDLARLARWYDQMQHKPSEYETVAYLIIPLLHALGWTKQKTAIEWNNVDIALFGHLPRQAQSLVGVVEAKRWGDSCLTARGQAHDYAQTHGSSLLERMVVTDGMRYGLYLRHRSEMEFEGLPDAYLNLTRLRWEYPILDCSGIGAGLQMMAADFRRQDESPEATRRTTTTENGGS